jgi:hypothetical protein
MVVGLARSRRKHAAIVKVAMALSAAVFLLMPRFDDGTLSVLASLMPPQFSQQMAP